MFSLRMSDLTAVGYAILVYNEDEINILYYQNIKYSTDTNKYTTRFIHSIRLEAMLTTVSFQ